MYDWCKPRANFDEDRLDGLVPDMHLTVVASVGRYHSESFCPRGWVATSESASAPTRSLEAAELVITFAVASDANIFVRLCNHCGPGVSDPRLLSHARQQRSVEISCDCVTVPARQWSRKKCLLASVIWQMISTKMAESSAVLQFPCRFPCDGRLFFLVPAVLFSPLPVEGKRKEHVVLYIVTRRIFAMLTFSERLVDRQKYQSFPKASGRQADDELVPELEA
ncbi:uncharacterized protein EV420DRAFT_1485914 [Desarmillaria tabescens]|uniref:Uncharacterized protein n=1 Tax=Armillaria tabescens TaxID=1929756 RepID=A0AA39JDL5_ARMTA|nr:uncharacterized protein EV420DRAFT_1485914 [Desarmillaria tabescens]KAK0440444.1 hypothetical protein EV420DRAFT_1485914 [Desarmillaria tabescens]